MSTFKRVLERIERNRNKLDNCIPFIEQLPRLSEYVPGIKRGHYYLISGASGSGKSQFTDEFFVFNPLDYVLSKKTNMSVKIIYFSFELDAESKMLSWILRRLYKVYNIRANRNILDSVGRVRVNDDILMAIKECQNYFERAGEYIDMIDVVKSPEEIVDYIHKYAKQNGEIVYKEVDGKKEFDHYIPKKEDEYVIIIVDHYSLIKNNGNVKAAIEKLSQGFVEIRNKYGYIPVPIQQQAASSEDLDHFKASRLEPSKEGLGESKLTYNDCDLALGLFCPYKHDIKNYKGYSILDLGDRYRNLNVFKNRYGESFLNVGVYFDGAVGFFKELPNGRDITAQHYDMVKKASPNWN